MSVSKQVSLLNRLSRKFNSSSENIGPAFVLYFGDASFCKHVITHIAGDLELFYFGESTASAALTDGLDDVCLEHGVSRLLCNPTSTR